MTQEKHPGCFIEGLEGNQCWEYLQKSIVKMGARFEGVCLQQSRRKCQRWKILLNFGLKQGKHAKDLFYVYLSAWFLSSVWFCVCFAFAVFLFVH